MLVQEVFFPVQSKQSTSYPTALKGCLGVVFTHDIQMGGWAVRQATGNFFFQAVSQKP